MRWCYSVICAIVFSLAASPRASAADWPPKPPERPLTGPGSTDYPHASFIPIERGKGDLAYFIFTPESPKPTRAPLVIFLHGFAQERPWAYGAWIMHLVRRGNVVIYPRYQVFGTLPEKYASNAIAAVKGAIEYMDQHDISIDKSRFAIVGHSCGGLQAANVAAMAADQGLPTPRAVMCVEPGRSDLFPASDFSKIPADTLLLTVAGDVDMITGKIDAKKILREATRVKPENRNMIIMRTDLHGSPAFLAGHLSPTSPDADFQRVTNPQGDVWNAVSQRLSPKASAIEYMGYWRLFDSLMHAGFTGEDRDAALGDTPRQRDMGAWSDGRKVREPVVVRGE